MLEYVKKKRASLSHVDVTAHATMSFKKISISSIAEEDLSSMWAISM